MKKIAFVRGTGVFNESRSMKEIFAFAEAGYFVEVLGWDRDGRAKNGCQEMFAGISDKVNFHFFESSAENGIGMKNIDKLIGWMRWVSKTLKGIDSLFAVHACDLDAGLPARGFCKKHHIKFVYDVFDYYIDSHYVPRFVRGLVENMEIKTINFADVTIICTEERKEQIQKSNPKKIVVVHNSPEIKSVEQRDEIMDCFYCGTMSGGRLILETINAYVDNTDLRVSFGGYGPYAEDAKRMDEAYDNFKFFGVLPYSKVLEIESGVKVLSAIYSPDTRNHRLCAPNKFYEALALGKPQIVCRGTGIDKIVEKNDIGMVIDYDANQFYEALRKLVADDEKRAQMGARARKLYEEKYDWAIMKRVLLEAYDVL